jgi:fumarate reductase flavoprotein subunit
MNGIRNSQRSRHAAPAGGDDDAVDVIVVGAGGAGLAAAIEASTAGACVCVLEKGASPGGSTALSVGSVTCSGTRQQRAGGIDDAAQAHWEDMAAFDGALLPRDNRELARVLCDEIPATFAWLERQGVRFSGPYPEPPHRQPRMHNVLPNSRAFVQRLARTARRRGVRFEFDARAVGLLSSGPRVDGVVYEQAGRCIRLRARRAVVLASGDFTNSAEYKQRFMGAAAASVPGINALATGDGQRMAEAFGGTVLNGDLALGPELRFAPAGGDHWLRRLPSSPLLAGALHAGLRWLPQAWVRPLIVRFIATALAPSPHLFELGAMLVDRSGALVHAPREQLASVLAGRAGGSGFIVMNDHTARQLRRGAHFISTAPGIAYAYLEDYSRIRPRIHFEARTPERLAQLCGMRAHALIRALGSRAQSDRFVALGPLRPVFVHSEGGLAVDACHCVLGADARPIPGLFAAGSTGQGGLLLKGHGHHLAWAFVSGRRAGRHAAALAPAAEPAFGPNGPSAGIA